MEEAKSFYIELKDKVVVSQMHVLPARGFRRLLLGVGVRMGRTGAAMMRL